jgi:hypothetical protein
MKLFVSKRYIVKVPGNLFSALMNGIDAVWPEAEMRYSNKSNGWCTFYKNGKKVWACNATFAQAWFEIEEKK